MKPLQREFDATGVPGLDEILGGGFMHGHLFVIDGPPGAGKTTLATQYLIEGARRGEPVLMVSLSETEREMREVAASHGWSLDGVTIRELMASEISLRPDEQYTMFHPSEVELGETTRKILADVDVVKPLRVVFDSLSELRLLASNPLRYRRQIMALKRFFEGRNTTVLLLDDLPEGDSDRHVATLAHGLVRIEQLNPEFGGERRRLRVVKYRGVAYRGGYHDCAIRTGGLHVFPRLVAKEFRTGSARGSAPSGIAELDALLGGGLERGTSTLIVGAAGTGKSSLAAQFASCAAARGERAAMFVFDESLTTLMARSRALGIDLERHVASGAVAVKQVDPAELSPGELVHEIQAAVDQRKVAMVVIDSLNGFLNAMPEERFLIIQLHELLSYLAHSGVVTILISAHQGLIGGQMVSPVDATYLADAVVLVRYFESQGQVLQALSVMKNRAGAHERTIREFSLKPGKISVGPVLREFRGVLTGMPIYEGGSTTLQEREKA